VTGLRADRVALNAIQWINVKADPADPTSEDLWLFADPAFRADYPRVLGEVRAAGFPATMLEVLDTQTLQDYRRMLDDAGLAVAPGYAAIALPEDHDVAFDTGSAEAVRWFDGIRRKAEESNFFGLSTVFLAPEVSWRPGTVRTLERVAVGADFDADRLDRVVEVLATAAEVLAAEGIRAGLHNHVGTWVETEAEIEYVLAAIPADLLGASFDIGHLAWAGIDPAAMLSRHADRLLDLHIKDLDLAVAEASRAQPTSYTAATDLCLFREPGHGDIDLEAVLSAIPHDWHGWLIVEVDRVVGDPAASARSSWAWVEAHLA
jgi:sugar phosphate isomerase/epimerase